MANKVNFSIEVEPKNVFFLTTFLGKLEKCERFNNFLNL